MAFVTSPQRRRLAQPFAEQWLQQKNKLLTIESVTSNSARMAWWRCITCRHEFRRRVHDHVRCQGACPQCAPSSRAISLDGTSPLLLPSPSTTNKAAEKQKQQQQQKASASVSSRKSSSPLLTAPSTDMMLFADDRRDLNPMLATSWAAEEPSIADDEPLMVSPKLDGVRCVIAYSQRLSQPYLMSRNGKIFDSCEHIRNMLRPLFAKDPTLVLDGELYNHDYSDDFSSLLSAVRMGQKNATEEHKRIQSSLQYHIFDIMYSQQITAAQQQRRPGWCIPYKQRFAMIESLVDSAHRLSKVDGESFLFAVPSVPAVKKDVETHLNYALRDRFEGIMIRRASAPYECSHRSKHLMKHKRFADSEFKILDVVEGTGRLAGKVGCVICKTKQGKFFRASLSVNEVEKVRLWRHRKQLIGQMLTVQYQDMSKYGVPRFPIGKAVRGSSDPATWI